MSSAVVIFEKGEPLPGQHVMHAILVGDVKREDGEAYCHYEAAVSLSWPIELVDDGPVDVLEGSYEGPKTWCID